ncbi:MAG: AbrB/MazE/SpoVT family DNA-binding domain-containing protein [Candidatus Aerophobetes bacterium]
MQVLISPKYQIVIPKAIRNKLKLTKGERMHIRVKGDTVILVPDKPIQSFRGVLKGTRLDDIREEGERL